MNKLFSIDGIKKIVKNNPRLYLLVYIFLNVIHDKSKCMEIINSQKNPYAVNYQHYGAVNKNKVLYIVNLSDFWKRSGYCHLLRMTLLELAYADYFRFTPIIRWSNDILYASAALVGKIDNPFEYFFENTFFISDEEVYRSNLVVFSKDTDVKLFESEKTYLVAERELDVLSKMIKKYLRFNETGIELIEEPVKLMFGNNRVLGVHVRKTDYAKNYNDHPVPIEDENILQKVQETFANDRYDRVFLATDSVAVLEEYKKVFGEQLLYNDVLRSDNGKALHYEFESNRENNNYLLGKEILLDTFSLGNCDGIIAGLSNVSILARAIKYSKEEKYLDEIIIDKGINSNLNDFKRKS